MKYKTVFHREGRFPVVTYVTAADPLAAMDAVFTLRPDILAAMKAGDGTLTTEVEA